MIINIILIIAILGVTGLIIYSNIKKKQSEEPEKLPEPVVEEIKTSWSWW